GTITGRVSAVSSAALADVTNAAGGVMQATSVTAQTATTIFGVDVSLSNAGTVQAGGGGSAVVVATGTADIRNVGLMQQEGDGGAVIVGAQIAKINSSGSIQTPGANGIAIFSPGLPPGLGIAGSVDIVSNSGTISATGAGGVAISAGIIGG